MFWGHVLAWGLVGAAALGLNKSILTDSDPMTPGEVLAYASGMFLASVTALCVLGRPCVTVREGTVFVRNPLRTYRFQLADVESLESGFWGFPRLIVAGRRIRAMGLEETTLDHLPGGSDDMAVLHAELGEQPSRHGTRSAAGIHARASIMDRGLAFLLAGWAAYALSLLISENVNAPTCRVSLVPSGR
jgi:hypothetical protein